jgi:hypothetical protein
MPEWVLAFAGTIERRRASLDYPKEEQLADRPLDAGTYVDAAAALIGLPLDPAHRPGVILNMQRIAEMAALVMAFPLPEGTEPAPVFRP